MLAPGAVLVGLLLGPAINLATAGWLWQTYGRRAALAGETGDVERELREDVAPVAA